MKLAVVFAVIAAATAAPNALPEAEALPDAKADMVERYVGEPCSYWDARRNWDGYCRDMTDCDHLLDFYVTGHCPHDPAHIKCCIDTKCSDVTNTGWCMNNSEPRCGELGGWFEAGLCPGPSGVRCCILQTVGA